MGLLLAAGSCATGPSSVLPERSPGARLPVLLVADGTALDARTVDDVATALSAAIGRPVVVAREPALDEAAERARLAERYGKLPQRGWEEERCALGRAAAHALRYDADAYYRLHLDRRDSTRDATAEERAAVSGARRAAAAALRGLKIGADKPVQTAELSGELSLLSFGLSPATKTVPVRASVQAVDALGRLRVDTAGEVARAAERLPRPAFPHWGQLARRQLAAGCRLTALAVYDGRLRGRPDSRGIADQALGRQPKRKSPPPVVAATPPSPAEPSDLPAPGPSCRVLCEIHMVELCNNDRDLWARHQALWQSTPCGQRRSEPFLRDCYQRQWLTGTFDEACMAPCEQAADGRARLLHMLQGSGCTRLGTL
ncbi:MAG TPA: hypothetical protein VNO26_09945 [Candidatus Limnocylindria bacterium]|nr:hypothetical protein [Candidatus Limnocylindria bacterium]